MQVDKKSSLFTCPEAGCKPSRITWRRISAVFLDTTSWLTLASLQSTSAVSLRVGRPAFQMPHAGRGGMHVVSSGL